MDLLGTKICALFLMFGIILLFFLLPIAVGKALTKRGQLVVDCITCFGGGVFLGIFMLHMTPEIRELLDESLLTPRGIDYPVPEAIAGGGFFMILLIEKLINYCNDSNNEQLSKAQELVEASQAKPMPSAAANAAYQMGVEDTEDHKQADSLRMENGQGLKDTGKQEELGHQIVPETAATRARTVVMLVALSLDCVFEGLSLGLKYTTVAVWTMFAGIIGHEFIISFCLGMEFVKTQPTRWVVLCAFMYAITPVIGVAIGLGIFHSQSDNKDIDLVNGCLQSVAAGVFLYCTFIGVLSNHLSHNAKAIKLFTTFLGFGLMAGLAAIPDGKDPEPEVEEITTLTFGFS